MDYTEIIYLITKTEGVDDIGNCISTSETSKKTYAKRQSVKTNEYYNALTAGYKPTIEFVIKRLNYSGESELKWNNNRYSIIRTVDPKNKFDIVLVCESKAGVNNSDEEVSE